MIDIKNTEQYKGKRIHTTEWPHDLTLDSLAGKKVGLIGAGASAVQVLPELIQRSKCAKVVQFQRTPVYCTERGQSKVWPIFKGRPLYI